MEKEEKASIISLYDTIKEVRRQPLTEADGLSLGMVTLFYQLLFLSDYC